MLCRKCDDNDGLISVFVQQEDGEVVRVDKHYCCCKAGMKYKTQTGFKSAYSAFQQQIRWDSLKLDNGWLCLLTGERAILYYRNKYYLYGNGGELGRLVGHKPVLK